ncbi:MAG: hypothetical protein VX899_21320 [Myxococcota bacterium]|nr:hypothetical protein [Myxococcota bacterium]
MSWLERHGHWALLALTLLAFLPALGGDFCWDDRALVLGNAVTADLWGNLGTYFTADLWQTLEIAGTDSGYYRPLMLLSLAVDRAIAGLSPAFAHAHSLAWHLAAVGALIAVLRRVLPPLPALLAATVFALHPLQIETVALVAARNDAMAAALGLGALWLVLDDTNKPVPLLGAGVLTWLAMLSKETAVLLPLFLLALDWARWGRPQGLWRYVSLAMGVGLFLLMRTMAGISGGLPEGDVWGTLLGSVVDLSAIYLSLLTLPWPLTPARHILYLPEHMGRFYALGALTLAGLVLAVWKGRDRKLVLAGLAWALLSFAPTLVATADKGLMGERYLYLPLAGLGLALAAALPLRPKLPLVVAGVFAALSVGIIELRLPDWKDSRTLWEAAHRVEPSPFTHGGLGWYVYDAGDYAQSREHFVGAVSGQPPYRDACTHLIMVELQLRNPAEAVKQGAWGLRDRACPRIPETLGYWAIALASVGRWDDAVDVAREMQADPFGHKLIIAGAVLALRQDFPGYDRVEANWKAREPMTPHVARLLRTAGEHQSADLVEAWKDGRLQRVDPSTLDAETIRAVEASGGAVIQAPR